MKPELLTGKNVIIQGITGKHGRFHTKNMLEYGTNIVAGTSPNQSVPTVHDVPVYQSIADIQAVAPVHASVVFVPAAFAASAIIEAIDARIPLIVVITEGIPVHDMIRIRAYNQAFDSVIIGPNCPGVLLPGIHSLGIIPAGLSLSGSTGIVSRSGTLTYEAMDGLTRNNIGQKYIVGIGGDRIHGAGFVECLELFEGDLDVEQIVMIGEIGGVDEIQAADYIKQHVSKPVYAYIAGHTAPTGVQLGHAGAILGTNSLETAAEKTAALAAAGATTADSLSELLEKMLQ